MRSRPLVVSVLCAVTVLLSGGAAPTAPAVGAAPPCADGTEVRTVDGPVCGVVGNGVTSWLGIPYAAPPVGELRWRPPARVTPWAETFPATRVGIRCPQPAGPGAPPSGEDCLKLNVRVPEGDSPRPLPVMVQLHGGGFLLFGPSDASRLAAAGQVISVEVGYRLGIFGFFAAEQLGPNSGNYALQDQQEALRWVRRNIAAFGGDPGNVTIYGASAGGSSVCAQLVSPDAQGLFHKGIIQSGLYNSLFGKDTSWQPQDCKARWPSEPEAQQAGARFTAAVGCAEADDVAACLRGLPVERLLAQVGNGLNPDSGTIAPVVDGKTIPLAPAKAIERGHLNRARVMTGVARDDVQLDPAETPEQYETLVREQYGKHAPAVFARYPLNRFPEPSAFLAYRTIVADSNSVCPSLVLAQRLARHLTVFAYQVDNPDSPPAGWLDQTKPNGAFHVSENTFLYARDGDLWNPNQNVYGRQLVAQWTGFARTGNPTVDGTPLWTPHTAADPRFMSLLPAGNSVMTGEIGRQHHCGFWNAIAPGPR
ncbi:para-nitrobenzyl esterase [Saccharothrix tamanrassetensis]|uniref:Carboxylic ester hydrolase n=1 Tax=Saccharothrix tamanrassetensis TaxID=1051531 RepID=A0A841CI89_9PSEU|nr:carboxylesterase family protein [Saccharothrix tamanrassetensis]MBB5958232.1 para-nitrobenzyl esterase [Saccharothrix tamanrassetensis]